MKTDEIKVIEEIFQIHKVFTISELAKKLDRPEITTRRRLYDIGYFSSYSHNSRYYTIKSVAKFNQYGIWQYNNIGFSIFGTLKKTITNFIDNSPHGMTVNQISDRLQIKCYSTLNLFYKNGMFNRIKYDKKYIYLSQQNDIYQNQLLYYKQLDDLKPQEAIQLLVEYINNPQSTCHELSQRLSKKNFQIKAETIHLFFQKRGVKKTPKL